MMADTLDEDVDEEYKVWKKNAAFLYDTLMTHGLEWPSLTVSWLPDKIKLKDEDTSEQRLILGTHTSGGEQNYLIIAKARLPLREDEKDVEQVRVGGYAPVSEKIKVFQKIVHDGDVNRARHMPHNPAVIATRASQPDVFVFDYTRHPSVPPAGTNCNPEIRLCGPVAEGYGLSWNGLSAGRLLAASEDSMICLWDVNAKTEKDRTIHEPLSIFKGHKGVVGDVAWHCIQEHFFGSVGDDHNIFIWDDRAGQKPLQTVLEAHTAEVNCLSFSPYHEFVFVTGSSDKMLGLWDLRHLKQSLHTFTGHRDEVFSISWAPFCETIIASSGADRRVCVWDLRRIGDEQSPDEAEDGPPELLFVHGGHTTRVSDISWNPNDDFLMASVAEDNVLHIWQMADTIYQDDELCEEGLEKSK